MVEKKIDNYINDFDEIPDDVSKVDINFQENINCNEIKVYNDRTVYLSKCKLDNDDILDFKNIDGYYHYGELATEVLLKKTNKDYIIKYTNGNVNEMYTFKHDATDQTEALIDYRYIGDNPYNYVNFNNELWRIIGIFKVEDGNNNLDYKIKIMRNEKLASKKQWDSNGTNNWINSSINSFLNFDYYDSLSESSTQMISLSKYYLGSGNYNSLYVDGEGLYNIERSNNVYGENPNYFIGKIGLTYPSEFKYSFALGISSYCYSNSSYYCEEYYRKKSWMYKKDTYCINSFLNNDLYVYNIYNSYADYKNSNSLYDIIPTLYLDKYVKIKSGDGSLESPYELEI